MKKYLSIVCALTMIASLAGCGASDALSSSGASKKTSSDTTNPAPDDDTTEAPAEEKTEPDADTNISIVSHSLSKDYNGKEVLVVEYAWTNTADKEKSFSFAVTDKAFQNGIECDSTVIGCDEIDSKLQLADVMPGTTINLKIGYHITDHTDVTIRVTDLIGSDTLLDEVIDLGGGAGTAPAEAESKEETSVKISGHHLSTDYSGATVLVVDYEFYNGEDEAKSFMWLFSDKAFQNGVECDDMVIGCDDIDSQSIMNDVQPGTTYTVSEAYHVADGSDVIIKVSDLWGGTTYIEDTISLN